MNNELLRSTFATILDREPAMTTRFYAILFSRYPAAKPLFGGSATRAQQEMLQGALVAVLDNLDNGPWLASTLSAMGAKHVSYGVTPEMFDWVGDSLLATLAEILDEEWNEPVAASWAEAYAAIRDLMLVGMQVPDVAAQDSRSQLST